jgi:hypothetical protein
MGVAIQSCEGEELLSGRVGDGMKERSEDKRKQKRVCGGRRLGLTSL